MAQEEGDSVAVLRERQEVNRATPGDRAFLMIGAAEPKGFHYTHNVLVSIDAEWVEERIKEFEQSSVREGVEKEALVCSAEYFSGERQAFERPDGASRITGVIIRKVGDLMWWEIEDRNLLTSGIGREDLRAIQPLVARDDDQLRSAFERLGAEDPRWLLRILKDYADGRDQRVQGLRRTWPQGFPEDVIKFLLGVEDRSLRAAALTCVRIGKD